MKISLCQLIDYDLMIWIWQRLCSGKLWFLRDFSRQCLLVALSCELAWSRSESPQPENAYIWRVRAPRTTSEDDIGTLPDASMSVRPVSHNNMLSSTLFTTSAPHAGLRGDGIGVSEVGWGGRGSTYWLPFRTLYAPWLVSSLIYPVVLYFLLNRLRGCCTTDAAFGLDNLLAESLPQADYYSWDVCPSPLPVFQHGWQQKYFMLFG